MLLILQEKVKAELDCEFQKKRTGLLEQEIQFLKEIYEEVHSSFSSYFLCYIQDDVCFYTISSQIKDWSSQLQHCAGSLPWLTRTEQNISCY